MELFSNIRLKIGKAMLTKEMARVIRKVYYSNINLVKSIGIIWDSAKLEDFAILSSFHQKMHDRNIEVTILGYFPGKRLPDQYTAIRYLSFIRREEMNFFYVPVSSETNTFINNRFEILIDINFKKLFPLQYISSLSNAGFKVGLFDSATRDTPFDLLMEIKNPVNVENYLDQIINYLEMINSGKVRTVEK
jgi:hypothetical protein